MKIFLFFLSLCLPFSLPALFCVTDCDTDWKLEVRAAYYQPHSKQIGKIYSRSWLDYEVEASRRVGCFCEIWGGVYWANKHGRADHSRLSGFKQPTNIHVLPLSMGAKFVYPLFPCAEVYFGAGPCYSFLRVHNHSHAHRSHWLLKDRPCKKNLYDYAWGGLFKTGIQIALCRTMFLDIFADYITQRFKVPSSEEAKRLGLIHGDIDCSGFKFGAGLGIYF